MKLALQLPWGAGSEPTRVEGNPVAISNFAPSGVNQDVTLGAVMNQFAEVALYIGAFLMFFWAVWGVFDYLKAEGNKEALAKARKKIIWAISGFAILIIAFFISDTLQSVVKPQIPPLTEIIIEE